MNDAPIVLVHGIFGFNQIKVAGHGVANYFRLIRKKLLDAGHAVPEPPALNTAGSIEERADDLSKYLQNNPEVAGRKVHLIAHSMGGLDSRSVISSLGMADRVISLTTIGTPHHGSPIADLIVAHTNPTLDAFVEHLRIDIKGLSDLTTDKCAEFNEQVFDSPDVRYFSIAGNPSPLSRGLLAPTHALVEGDNDGLVPVESARFGQQPDNWKFLGTWDANHFRLINWGMAIIPDFLELVDDTIVDNYKAIATRVREL